MRTYYDDKEFDRIYIEKRRNMKNVVFRVEGPILSAKMPMDLPLKYFVELLDEKRPQLREMIKQIEQKQANTSFYYDGMVIPFIGGGTITLKHDPAVTDSLLAKYVGEYEACLILGSMLSFDCLGVQALIRKGVLHLLTAPLKEIIFPMALKMACQFNLPVRRFESGRGFQKLGHCTQHNVIQLSRALALLPEHLVRYVICHELAHVTHKNHSPEFHRLVDVYTGGLEKELEKELKAFKWPILRR